MGCEQKGWAQLLDCAFKRKRKPHSIDWNLGMTVGAGATMVGQMQASRSSAHFLTGCDRERNYFLVDNIVKLGLCHMVLNGDLCSGDLSQMTQSGALCHGLLR